MFDGLLMMLNKRNDGYGSDSDVSTNALKTAPVKCDT
jgi:hypothetical protein